MVKTFMLFLILSLDMLIKMVTLFCPATIDLLIDVVGLLENLAIESTTTL